VLMYGSGYQGNLGTSVAPVLRREVRTFQVDKYNAQVNAENNTMTFHFGSEGLNLPPDAKNVTAGVPMVLFWNKLDNITTPSYISVKVPGPTGTGTTGTDLTEIKCEIRPGMWDVASLIQTLETALLLAPPALVMENLPKDYLSIEGDNPTQTILLRLRGRGAFRFGSAELAYMLGFANNKGAPGAQWNMWHEWDGQGVPAAGITVAPFMAHVQSVEYLQLRCSLLGAGQGIVGRGGGGEGVIATLPITGQAYGQSLYTRGMGEMLTFPLRSKNISSMTLSLIDNDGFPVKGLSPALPWTAQVSILFDTFSDQN